MKKIIVIILFGLILLLFYPCSAYDVKGRDTVEQVTDSPTVGLNVEYQITIINNGPKPAEVLVSQGAYCCLVVDKIVAANDQYVTIVKGKTDGECGPTNLFDMMSSLFNNWKPYYFYVKVRSDAIEKTPISVNIAVKSDIQQQSEQQSHSQTGSSAERPSVMQQISESSQPGLRGSQDSIINVWKRQNYNDYMNDYYSFNLDGSICFKEYKLNGEFYYGPRNLGTWKNLGNGQYFLSTDSTGNEAGYYHINGDELWRDCQYQGNWVCSKEYRTTPTLPSFIKTTMQPFRCSASSISSNINKNSATISETLPVDSSSSQSNSISGGPITSFTDLDEALINSDIELSLLPEATTEYMTLYYLNQRASKASSEEHYQYLQQIYEDVNKDRYRTIDYIMQHYLDPAHSIAISSLANAKDCEFYAREIPNNQEAQIKCQQAEVKSRELWQLFLKIVQLLKGRQAEFAQNYPEYLNYMK
jgi:hypothetical protein